MILGWVAMILDSTTGRNNTNKWFTIQSSWSLFSNKYEFVIPLPIGTQQTRRIALFKNTQVQAWFERGQNVPKKSKCVIEDKFANHGYNQSVKVIH